MVQPVIVSALLPLCGEVSIEVLWVVTEQGPCLVMVCEVIWVPVVVQGLGASRKWDLVPMQNDMGWVVLWEVGLE